MLCALLIVCLAVLVSGASYAGYEFTISASAIDPFQNTAPPAGSTRNLYLWLTCTDEGLSALEGDVTGTLSPFGFYTLNGVVNAGGPGDLLLGVPNCPQGNVNFLMGYWIVSDNGGTLCLKESAKNNRILAVDCSANPEQTESPRVIGFSSTSAPPCEIGESSCDAGEAEMSASYSEIAEYSGSFIYGVDWSPTGESLLFNGTPGLYVLDGEDRSANPRKLMDKSPRYARWSPDGTWVLCKTQSKEEARKALFSLSAVPMDGRPPIAMATSQDIGSFLWGEDGVIYYWNDSSGELKRVDPPLEWVVKYERKPTRPAIVSARDGQLPGRDFLLFWPDGENSHATRLEQFSRDRRTQVLAYDDVPGFDRFLVRVYDPCCPGYDLILDAQGNTVMDFRSTDDLERLVRTSISSDRKYLAAYSEVDDEHTIASAQLYIVSPKGKWRVEISDAPMGILPRLSNKGHLIAFEGIAGGIHVGQLVIADALASPSR